MRTCWVEPLNSWPLGSWARGSGPCASGPLDPGELSAIDAPLTGRLIAGTDAAEIDRLMEDQVPSFTLLSYRRTRYPHFSSPAIRNSRQQTLACSACHPHADRLIRSVSPSDVLYHAHPPRKSATDNLDLRGRTLSRNSQTRHGAEPRTARRRHDGRLTDDTSPLALSIYIITASRHRSDGFRTRSRLVSH